MKLDTLSMRIKKAWPTVLQPVLLLLAVLVGVGSFVLVASGKQKSAKAPEGPPPSILMVGDSLSVGKFGEVVQGHLGAEISRGRLCFLRFFPGALVERRA